MASRKMTSKTRSAKSGATGLPALSAALILLSLAYGAALAGSGNPWGANYFPNHELTAHTGEKLRFFDDVIAGKVVAVNFIYTRCTDVCPMETARMVEVHRLLGDRVGSDVFFYSISIDPEHDTVEVLRDYVKRYGIDGDNWKFLTGNKAQIDEIRERFGLEQFVPGQQEDLSDHNINLVIGNQATGQWVRRSPFENPYVLANQLGSWLHGFKAPTRYARNDYAKAPKLRQISAGEALFRNRCSSCHVISGGLAPTRNARPLGPDLFAVTERRDGTWLRRWLREPDRMLAEKDPIATAMFEKWQVKMPNFNLSDTDIDLLVEHMATETARLRQRSASRRQETDHARAARGESANPAAGPVNGTASGG